MAAYAPADGADQVPDSVLGKARSVLEAFAIDDVDLSLSELARRSGVPKASVHRLAQELVGWGLLERSGVRYRLGLRLFELGSRVPRQRILREAALPFLEELVLATRETVHCAVLDGREVLYVEKLSGHRSVQRPSRLAGRLPLHCTATGKVLLAFSPRGLLDEVVRAGLARRTPYTTTSPKLLREQLDRVRRVGTASECEETRLGHLSVAAPVFGAHRVLAGAVSLTAPTTRSTVQRLEPAVRSAADGISRALAAAVDPDGA